MRYTKTSPCDACPFRTDIPSFLTKERGREIADSLRRGGEFPCHKTTVAREEAEGGETKLEATKDSLFCAGALLVMENEGFANQMMRICERLGLYDASKLDREAPVFRSLAAFAKAQGLTSRSAKVARAVFGGKLKNGRTQG